jgi:hypothetical protein
MKKQLFVMMLVTSLVGCQSHIRPYDGVIGYQVQSQQPMRLVFTDEDRLSWPIVQARAQKSCAAVMQTSVENLQFRFGQQTVIQQSIGIPVTLPVGVIDVRSSNQKGLSIQTNDVTTVEKTSRPFKQLTVECQPKS